MANQYNGPGLFCESGADGVGFFGTGGIEAGVTIVAFFACTASSADMATPPPSIRSTTGGFNFSLAYASINNACALGGLFNGMAVYVCEKTAFWGGTITVGNPFSATSDVVTQWSGGFSFTMTFATLSLDVATFETAQVADFPMSLTQSGSDDLVLGAVFDAALTGTPTFATYLDAIEYEGSPAPNFSSGWQEASLADATDVIATTVTEGASTDMFAFLIAFQGSNATGGGAATTLTFSMNKGPNPIPPPEGRAIATVQIDCTQQPIQPSVNYPELAILDVTDISNFPIQGFTVVEFDLEHLFQGSGLSEVRSVAWFARPYFDNVPSDITANGNGGREDIGPNNLGEVIAFGAILTNTTTLQSILIGAAAGCNPQNSGEAAVFVQDGISSMPANKHSLKYRLIVMQATAGPMGKFTLNFMNFEVMPFVGQPMYIANK